MPDLDPWVTAAYRRSSGLAVPDPQYLDFLTAFRNDPDLVVAARAEVTRLTARNNRHPHGLAAVDHDAKMRAQTLRRMLAQFDGTPEEPTDAV